MKRNLFELAYVVVEKASNYLRSALLANVNNIVSGIYSIAWVVKRLTRMRELKRVTMEGD